MGEVCDFSFVVVRFRRVRGRVSRKRTAAWTTGRRWGGEATRERRREREDITRRRASDHRWRPVWIQPTPGHSAPDMDDRRVLLLLLLIPYTILLLPLSLLSLLWLRTKLIWITKLRHTRTPAPPRRPVAAAIYAHVLYAYADSRWFTNSTFSRSQTTTTFHDYNPGRE